MPLIICAIRKLYGRQPWMEGFLFGSRALMMRMHVPKTGNQKLSSCIHSGCTARDRDSGADRHHPLTLCNHGYAILQPAGCHFDHSDFRDG